MISGQFLLSKAEKNNIVAITDNATQMSYSELSDLSSKLNNKIKERCLVFCLAQNSIGSFVGYVSFISNKIVPVMLEASLDITLLDDLISTYNPKYLWLPNKYLSNFSDWEVSYSLLDYSLIKNEAFETYPMHDDLALLLTTSGSTGSPKLVRISYENIEANAVSIAEYLSINKEERPITTLPMSYSFGLSIINSHMLKGATILLTSKSLMERGFWDFFKDKKATSMSGVPYTFEILNKLRFFRMDLPYLKTLTQAGGKLNNELNNDFSKFCQQIGKRFFVMYGQTEATARMSYLPHQYSISKLGSMGIAIPGGEFNLIDENGTTVKENEIVGELVYRGKNVSMGYAECVNDFQKDDENKGILITGDLAKRDSDSFYYIVGRKKRFIKIYGNRVNLDETERLLKSIIPECACTGVDDKMIVYISDMDRIDEVRNFISSKTGIHHSAFSIRYVEVIPKNTSGKTIYSGLTV
jgi:long-chain acyl-CoA synthetase